MSNVSNLEIQKITPIITEEKINNNKKEKEIEKENNITYEIPTIISNSNTNTINNKIMKAPEIKIDMPNTTYSIKINTNTNEIKCNLEKNNLVYYNTNNINNNNNNNNNDLSGYNSQEKFGQNLLHTYSNSLN